MLTVNNDARSLGNLVDQGSGQVVPLLSSEDVVRLRQALRIVVTEIQLTLVEQTKFVTAASELARNVLDYGGGGEARILLVQQNAKRGVRIAFVDQGPGIADIDLALKDGYTSGGGMGLGLGGAKRLSDEFVIDTKIGEGTCITITKWNAF
jgi:serine/threonine-protein kinase RsbT